MILVKSVYQTMLGPVPRAALAESAARALREALARGDFTDILPPERALAELLGVSRPVVRASLAILARDGLVASSPRAPWQVTGEQVRGGQKSSPVVRFLSGDIPMNGFSRHLQVREYLARHLARRGFSFHLEMASDGFREKGGSLGRLVSSRPADVWVLNRVPEATQRWFQERRPRCLVFGSCFPGIALASLDEDYAASGRHAAGMFVARGHRRLAAFHPAQEFPGDIQGLEAFREAVTASQGGASLTVCRHDNDTARIAQAAARLLRLRPRVTGWFVTTPFVYFTVCGVLARAGLRLGRDVSVICRNHDPYFEACVPSVACYRPPALRMQHRLLALIIIVAAGGMRNWSVRSEFVDGGSFGPR